MLLYEHPVRFGPPHFCHLDPAGSFLWTWEGAERSGGHLILSQDHVCGPSSAYPSLQTIGEASTTSLSDSEHATRYITELAAVLA